jgi:outer membrane protein OmpA-like peptidoglycan-associated protein
MNRLPSRDITGVRLVSAIVLVASMTACTSLPPTPGSAPAPSPAAGPAPIAMPIDAAILKAANDLFSKAPRPSGGPGLSGKQVVVIDPLIDGVSGVQSQATQFIEARIVELVRTQYPQFDLQPFSASSVAQSPLLLIGTLTGVNQQGHVTVPREAYRIWLTLADVQTGKIVAKARAHATPDGVDIRPTAYFHESPVLTTDPVVEGYIKTCQESKVGDPIDPVYAQHLPAAAVLSDAIKAYNSQRYGEALELYKSVLRTPAGAQLRVYNGLYLTHWQLGHRDEAAQAFGRMIAYGLAQEHLAVKFLFKPGSTAFWSDAQLKEAYPVWLQQIARRTSQHNACLEIVGHTTRTGSAPRNDRLSLRRAQYIKQRLESEAPQLSRRTRASGQGSRANLIGTATDDVRDALDRRVEFKVIGCFNGAVAKSGSVAKVEMN